MKLPSFMTQGASLGSAAIGEVRRTDVLLLELSFFTSRVESSPRTIVAPLVKGH